ncbi:hypothetical protein F2Q70_00026861 [Brassica cretica]|uniref:Uncharacterized protein n=1 Tax=Brassica cretica TaxID=69181 RepID=A0A8S9L7E4_BRACR|nr:hypothetical protein F2Q70_00026861 [Brassica cretica]
MPYLRRASAAVGDFPVSRHRFDPPSETSWVERLGSRVERLRLELTVLTFDQDYVRGWGLRDVWASDATVIVRTGFRDVWASDAEYLYIHMRRMRVISRDYVRERGLRDVWASDATVIVRTGFRDVWASDATCVGSVVQRRLYRRRYWGGRGTEMDYTSDTEYLYIHMRIMRGV